MATISVSQSHTRQVQEVREMAAALAENLRSRYDLRATWLDDNTIDFQRRGIRGRLHFNDSEVNVELHLGMMVSPFKERIRGELERALRERLG